MSKMENNPDEVSWDLSTTSRDMSDSDTSEYASSGKPLHQTCCSDSSASGSSSKAAVDLVEIVARSALRTPEAEGSAAQAEYTQTLHLLGHCRPCPHMRQSQGCHAGDECKFCHEPHGFARSTKSKRRQVERVLAKIEAGDGAQPRCLAEVAKLLNIQSASRGRETARREEETGNGRDGGLAAPRASTHQTADLAQTLVNALADTDGKPLLGLEHKPGASAEDAGDKQLLGPASRAPCMITKLSL